MQIAFITDFHTGTASEHPFEVNVRQNFLDMIETLRNRPFDRLVIGGDLCLTEGSAEIYAWQKKHLDSLSKPYYLIAGNHDDQRLLAKTFNNLEVTAQGEIYYELIFDRLALLFLDTARKKLSDQQKKWLLLQLDHHRHKELIVFMHHPPALMGVPFMDNKHALIDRDEILSMFFNHSGLVHIFSGHYHVQKSLFIKNVAIHVTPSLYFQIDPFTPDFNIDHRRIGYRMIDVSVQSISTSVHYL